MSEQSQPLAKNLQAVLDYCDRINRPDLKAVVMAEKNNDGFILLLQLGFEAGRTYQHDTGLPLENKNYMPPQPTLLMEEEPVRVEDEGPVESDE